MKLIRLFKDFLTLGVNIVQTGNIPNTSLSDGVGATPMLGGKASEGIVTELHGKYFTAAYRGRTFTAGTVIAGVVIPVAATTLSSTFTIYNPAGSGVIVELISFHMATDTATTVVNGIGLMIQRSTTSSGGVPTLTTATNAFPTGIGGVAKASVWAQATLTNVAIAGVLAGSPPFPYYNMFTFGAVTDTAAQELTHNFDGRILLGPDDLAAAVTSKAASQQGPVNIVWAEWPL